MFVPAPVALTFDKGRVVTPGDPEARLLTVRAGRIAACEAGTRVDCTGFLLLPGIIDLHGDGFERHVAPRRGALRSLSDGVAAVAVELAANGITTAWLPQFWSWEGGMRGPDFACALAAEIGAYGGPVDLRMQVRFDIACYEDAAALRALIEAHGLDALVLNDRLPHAALAAGKRPPRLDGQALRARRSPAAHLALMQRLHAAMPGVEEAIAGLLRDLDGVRVGSHDDDTAETRRRYRALGASFAEFPTTRDAAMEAQMAGEGVVLGAPNVVRGGSHGGGVSARAMIADGLCDALASDYHYPALHHAAFALEASGMPLAKAWALVSSGPARVMGLQDRGTFAPGQRADIVIVEKETRRIVGTLCAGQFAYLTEPLAGRVLAAARG